MYEYIALLPYFRQYYCFLEDNILLQLLLYGDEKFKLEDNQIILKATIKFIRDSSRFSHM